METGSQPQLISGVKRYFKVIVKLETKVRRVEVPVVLCLLC